MALQFASTRQNDLVQSNTLVKLQAHLLFFRSADLDFDYLFL